MTGRPAEPRWTSAQVARHLQVRIETVYAYVSRGVLQAHRIPGQRGSYFDESQVRALTRPQGVRRTRRSPGLSDDITTAITAISDRALTFRGHDVLGLIDWPYERVCAMLWQQELAPEAFGADPGMVSAVGRAVAALPTGAGPLDAVAVAVQVASILDPARDDLSPAAVARAGARSIAAAVSALGGATGSDIAARLAGGLRGAPVRRGSRLHALIVAALAVLADHDMALSTTTARACASVRADPYAVLGAGLNSARSPWHGRAPARALAMLLEAMDDPPAVLSAMLSGARPTVGFGHLVLTESDPRAEALLGLIGPRLPTRLGVALELLGTELWERRGLFPNVDLALAALVISQRLPPSAGETIFSVARMAGWLAHALEEYAAEPLRFRLRGVYIGPPPGSPVLGPGC